MSDVPNDFDPIAAVVDCLDACRRRDFTALIGLYDDSASLECACEGIVIHGRGALKAYWHSADRRGCCARLFELRGQASADRFQFFARWANQVNPLRSIHRALGD